MSYRKSVLPKGHQPLLVALLRPDQFSPFLLISLTAGEEHI